MAKGLRCSLLAVLLFSAACLASPVRTAAAQEGSADRPIAFDIAAQPLDAALAEYFRLTGVQLLYDSSLTAGRMSRAVQGSFTPREALRRLLAETGLLVRYSRARAAIIVAGDTGPADTSQVPLGRVVVRERIGAPGISPVERLAYYDRLEEELRDCLRADNRTRRLEFSVIVALSLSESGQITAVRLQRRSGNSRTDELLQEVLTGRTVSQPPAGLAQPLAVALSGNRRR